MKKYFEDPKVVLSVAGAVIVLVLGTYIYLRKMKQKEDYRNKILDLTVV